MNSVLQCLSNTKPLLLYVLKDDLEHELNKSSTSVMKGVLMRGERKSVCFLIFDIFVFVEEYANLIRQMWSTSDSRAVISPLSFKNTIGKFAPRFTGFSYVEQKKAKTKTISSLF